MSENEQPLDLNEILRETLRQDWTLGQTGLWQAKPSMALEAKLGCPVALIGSAQPDANDIKARLSQTGPQKSEVIFALLIAAAAEQWLAKLQGITPDDELSVLVTGKVFVILETTSKPPGLPFATVHVVDFGNPSAFESVKKAFPGVGTTRVPLVITTTDVTSHPTVEAYPVPPLRSPRPITEKGASYADLVPKFSAFLESRSLAFQPHSQIDALAAYLSSQFLLLAGPSGSGKSTLARALLDFFVPTDSQTVIEGRRQLIGPEDIAGYWSPIVNSFIAGYGADQLAKIGRGDEWAPSPALLVEEVNLSPLEGYLAPLMHGLSAVDNPSIEWQLGQAGEASTTGSILQLTPFPRLIGTLNLDATAAVPAPKVVSRACVILVEPTDSTSKSLATSAGMSLLDASDRSTVTACPDAIAAVSAPSGAYSRLSELKRSEILTAVGNRVEDLRGWLDGQIVTHRALQQLIAYTATYGELAQGVDGITVGVDNAILHHILPSLSASDISSVLPRLGESAQNSMVEDCCRRLLGNDTGSALDAQRDYWDRLS